MLALADTTSLARTHTRTNRHARLQAHTHTHILTYTDIHARGRIMYMISANNTRQERTSICGCCVFEHGAHWTVKPHLSTIWRYTPACVCAFRDMNTHEHLTEVLLCTPCFGMLRVRLTVAFVGIAGRVEADAVSKLVERFKGWL